METAIAQNKKCPRCGIAFKCNAAVINKCQCYGIAVNKKEQGYISKQFTGCICNSCLKDLAAAYKIETAVNG